MSEGAGAYLGVGYERARGIPGPITSYFEFMSETLGVKYERKPNPNINPRRANQKGRLTSVDIKGNIKSAPDSESQARIRASHQGKVVTTTLDAPNTVYQHVLSTLMPGDAAEATYRKTLSGVVYRDDSAPMMVMGGVVDAITCAVKQKDFVEETNDLTFTHYTRMRQPIANVGNDAAWTGWVSVRGVRRDASNITDSYFLKCVTTGALNGTAKVVGKIGAATAYDDTKVMTPLASEWFDLLDEDGEPIGADDNRNPAQGLFHKALVGDVLTEDDEWEIKPRMAVISPTYTAREVYDAAQVALTVEGESYVFHSATLKGTKPQIGDAGIGSIYTQQVLPNGEWMWTLDAEREYIDTTFVDAIENGAIVSVVMAMTGAKIGASAFRDSKKFTLASMQYDEVATNVSNANSLKEKLVLKAFDDGVNPICEERHVNTMSAL